MIRSVLIPLDGSKSCHGTVEVAIEMAKSGGFTLVGIGVVDIAEILKPQPVPMGAQAFKDERDQALLNDARSKIAEFVTAFEARCKAAGVASRALQTEGRASDEVGRAARHHDVVFLSRETHMHFETQDNETDVLHELAREAARPLLAFPPEPSRYSGKGVLVAYDDSMAAARTLQLFQLSGIFSEEKITVLGVADTKEGARTAGAPALDFLRGHNRSAELLTVVSSHDSREILEAVGRTKPRLVVMGAFGHTGIKSRIFGSVTRSLLDPRANCPAPIFIYH